MYGSHCIKSWASAQGVIALSSGEAEYYGVVKAASVGLGIKSMLTDLGFKLELEVLTDASAAKGIASRRGLGKTRHVAVHFLWVQERVRSGDLTLSKVWGGGNPADLLTKYLTRDKMNRCMITFNLEYMDGRSAIAPAVTK